ncbi:MAG: sodium:proton antiporter, partial [Bacteroidales bacterium]|nr:sodium:proton antiporter [Bacteroidales bacterium]
AVSLIPVVLLVALLSVCIYLFGDAMLSGPSQIVLMFVVGIVGAIAILVYKKTWGEF